MKRKSRSSAAGFLLVSSLGLLACGGETSDKTAVTETASTTASSGAPSTTAASPEYDLMFIDAMSKHHQGAVEMAKMAAERATDPKIKTMAAKMMADQQREIVQLKGWRDQWFASAAPADTSKVAGASSMNMDMSHMQSLSGPAFDTMFIDMMVPHHEGAVTMSCEAHEKAGHAEIRNFSRNVIRAQEQEISELQSWKSAKKEAKK